MQKKLSVLAKQFHTTQTYLQLYKRYVAETASERCSKNNCSKMLTVKFVFSIVAGINLF